MPALPQAAKAHIAQRLARFDSPSAVAASVKDLFGIEITRQGVEAYDPTKRAGRSLTPEYAAAFMAERNAFLADTVSAGIASRVVRLRNLDRMCGRAKAMGNFPLVARILEQAAKEVGGKLGHEARMASAR